MSVLLTRKQMFHPYHLPLILFKKANQCEDINHHHEFHEIVFVEKGEGIHYTDNYEFAVQAKDVFIIKPGITHNYRQTNDLSIINILYFPEEIGIAKTSIEKIPGYKMFFDYMPEIGGYFDLNRKLQLNNEQFLETKSLLRTMDEEIHDKKPGFECMVISKFLNMICLLARCYQSKNRKLLDSSLNLHTVFTYIDKHYGEPITLDDLAQKANMSVSSLSRLFQKTVGQSPIEYLIRKRVSKAGEILINSTLNISEIAARTGFQDSNYFSRQFKKYTGTSPRNYKKWYTSE